MPKINLNQLKGTVLRRRLLLYNIYVPMGQNWVVLSPFLNKAPSEPAAIDSNNLGTICINITTIDTHSLSSVTGTNIYSPKNICIIREHGTGVSLISGTRKIYGLLQCAPAVVDGNYFDDDSKQAQISFIRQKSDNTGYEPCPIVDIEGKNINYEYVIRINQQVSDDSLIVPVFEEPILGLQGPKGNTGEKGDKGDRGDIGPPGPPGSAEDALTLENHAHIRQLIHFINEGPAEGFASGAYCETLPSGNPFPTSIIWWESSDKTKKIVEENIVYNQNKTPSSIVWNMYDEDGSTVLTTITDSYTYSGIIETSRIRSIS